MANPTTNYSFAMPTNTDLVKDLPADFEIFGQAVDTQMKTNADAAIAKTIVDAKGDIIAATAADTVARLAVGTNNQVLTADSTASTGLKWATPASPSVNLQLLSTTTLSGSTLTVSGISNAGTILIAMQGFNKTLASGQYQVRLNGDTASNYFLAGYNAFAGQGLGEFRLYNKSQTNQEGYAYILIEGANASGIKSTSIGIFDNSTGQMANFQGFYAGTSTISSASFICETGSWNAGSVKIYTSA